MEILIPTLTALIVIAIYTVVLLLFRMKAKKQESEKINYEARYLQLNREYQKVLGEFDFTIQSAKAIFWSTDHQLIFTDSRGAGLVELGFEQEEATGQSIPELFALKPDDPIIINHKAALRGESRSFKSNLNGRSYHCHVKPIRNANLEPTGVMGFAFDITEQALLQSEFRKRITIDALTNMINREAFVERLEKAMRHQEVHPDYRFGVLFIDLDAFKEINDSLGHGQGDEIIRMVGNRIKAQIGQEDVASRFGGDEFAVFVNNLKDDQDVEQLARRIHREMKTPIHSAELQLYVNASIGACIVSAGLYSSSEHVLRDADTAMYRAKDQGQGKTEFFTESMRRETLQRLHIKNDIRHGLKDNQFVLFYQPLVELKHGRIIGVESLIRWLHPEEGLISPGTFLPVAEQSGLMQPLGDRVLFNAISQMAYWQTHLNLVEGFQIHVNIAAQQLSDDRFVDKIDMLLNKFGVSPFNLTLELTESSFIHVDAQNHNIFESLRAMGIKLSIDDFGTGYSSLSYLHKLPLDQLKIDKSFVDRIDEPGAQNGGMIVKAVNNLGLGLNATVTAEGIETKEQLDYLTQIGCTYGQGYFFSPPLSEDQITGMLKNSGKSSAFEVIS